LHRKSKDIRIDRNRNQPKTQSTAVMLASDWHIEENINPETINYLNEYNPEIAKERAEKFWQNGLHLIDMMAKDERIENVVV
jgi:kynurenine formamidase